MDDKRFERVEDKLDIIVDRIGKIEVTLAAQHVSLNDHMRRTNLLEVLVAKIMKHVNTVDGLAKLVLSGSAVAAVIELYIKYGR